MKNLYKRAAALALAATMTAGVLAGYNGSNTTASTGGGEVSTPASGDAADPASQPSSEPQEITQLIWYMSINPVAADTEKVIEKLNEYTREKIGVEIDYKVIANPDYKEKMPNLINAGEYFDICFTSNWTTDYLQFVGKDAFMDITELLPQYAQDTYKFIPEAMWNAVKVNGSIYGVPSYKEMGWQGGLVYNSDMAEAYGLDMTAVTSLEDYTDVLKTVSEKSKAEGKDVVGVSGLTNAWPMAAPYESLTGTPSLPAAGAVPEFKNFADVADQGVFNQYTSEEYMNYCQTVRGWNQSGYLGGDPVNYDSDTANRDNDFNNGALFSYFIQYAPGTAESMSASSGHGVGFAPLMQPLFETRSAMGGLLALSSASEHPEKALEFINLLNTDEYVGTLIRHGIEGEHYTAVGENQVDKTMGGTLTDNGYDYTYGWQFGTPFNQKWDISYPENIEELFMDYNESAIISPNNGFTFDTVPVETQVAALTNTIAEYAPSLETGSVDPADYIPKFLEALNANGAEALITEVKTQLDAFNASK